MAGDQSLALLTPLRRSLVALIASSLVFSGLLVTFNSTPARAATNTIVSLTFDDGSANQFAAAQKLKSAGMAGTFYLNSGVVGQPAYLTLQQVKDIRAMGHEIGSHTISHADLTTLSPNEAKRQICNDRVNWANWGMPVASFAYPFAASTPAVEKLVADCGFNSARGLGDVLSPLGCPPAPDYCPNGVYGEAVPPANAFNTMAPDQVERTWSLDQLKKSVTQAEESSRSEWLQLTFHNICTNMATCPEPGFDAAIFNDFVDWLAARSANGTVVKTVGDVIGGSMKPAVPGPAVIPVTEIQNGNLESINSATGLPQCFTVAGELSPTYATTTDAHSGTGAVTLTVSGAVAGEAKDTKLLPLLDSGECAPAATPGEFLTLSEWYKSSAVTQFALYYRTTTGSWVYWTSSPYFEAATNWTEATWQTPAVPAGATAVSFGLNMFNNGTITVDDFSLVRRPVAVPNAPQDVSASPGNSSATVKWAAPVNDGGSPITGYTVRAYLVGGTDVVKSTTVSGTATTVTGLANGTAYVFRVTASNSVGEGTASEGSDPVTPVAPVTVPGAPSGIRAVAGNGSATVSWTTPAASGGAAIVGYTVTSSPGGKTCTTNGATSCVVSGLSNGTGYRFTVRARNAVGTGPASAVSALVTPAGPATPPAKPVNPGIPVRVAAAKAGYGDVLSVNVDPDSRRGSYVFRVERKSASGTWSPVGSYRTTGRAQTKSVTLGAGVYRVVVPAAGGYGSATSADVRLTARTVKVKLTTDKAKGKLKINVDPNKGSGYWKFKVQKLNAKGTWSTLSTTYKTSGKGETRTINKGKGTYRVVVAGKYGYLGVTSTTAALRK